MAWRAPLLRVEELEGERWALALELLSDGQQVIVADVVLTLGRPGLLTATARTGGQRPGEITAAAALADLARAESVLSEVRRSSPEFRELVLGREVELDVVVDLNTTTILVARSRHGHAAWADGSPLSIES
jgi:hypothetical protein